MAEHEERPEARAEEAEESSPLEAAAFGPVRRRLPDTRESITHKFSVCGTEGYIIVGLYEDGKPGEVFIKVAKEGSTLGGLMDGIGVLTSMCLQHGVPVSTLAAKMSQTRFEPSGHTTNPELREASSLLDYIFRWLETKNKEGNCLEE